MAGDRPHRDDQCLERGPALSHVSNRDGYCTFCHLEVSVEEVKKGTRPMTFTDKQVEHYRFFRWLHEHGRV